MNDAVRPDEKLPKSEIIRKKADFNEVFEKGRSWNGQILKCLYAKSNRRMVGFVVSRRFGNAVHRNRAKRMMREAWRKNRHGIGGYIVVLMPRSGMKKAGGIEVESELRRFLSCGALC
ncbi:MAG: ribonuclease P protein component [Acidobacteriota bacterium]|nr:ribonuclease P protein component [Acidobacteriota bacterium]